jgi:seryl-tRNA synthetase
MLELSTIRNRKQEVIQGLENRFIQDAAQLVEEILGGDEKRRNIITEVEGYRQEMNQLAKSIGGLMKAGKREEAEAVKAKTADLKARIKSLDTELQKIEERQEQLLVDLPNVNHPSVPVGKSEQDNAVVFKNEVEVTFDFDAKPHWDLATDLNIISWELGNKLTGAGFPVYIGKGAALQRALINWFLRRASEAGFIEIQPPLVVNEASGFATGQLPDKEGQMYHVTAENLYLIPTAEVPVTNIFRDVILEADQLPVKHCGYTPCFRREAGSYGKDVRGLNRLHQFDKVEIVVINKPENSYEMLEEMTLHVKGLLDDLGLPYRQLLLCTGDTGFTSAKTYDMEVWSAAQERWLEVSSISNFETFQANRLKLRYRDENRKTQLAHTLNGSALALPRILAALLENNQQADGSILIPEVLRPYTGFDRIGG